MKQARISNTKSTIDDSFQTALDEKLQKISVIDALKRKARNPKAIFYCPKCYQLDPNNKTIVIPVKYRTPYFKKLDGQSHLHTCQYKNAAKYLETISQQIGITIDDKQIQLSLMPYEGRNIVELPLNQRKRNLYLREDHVKFMKLVRKILTNYEIKHFKKRYNKYKIQCGTGKPKSLRQLFTFVTNIKANSYPYEEKLNLVVGEITNVQQNHSYLILTLDSKQSPYQLHLLLDRFFYSIDVLKQLQHLQVCCMGYIRKYKDNLFYMEVFSVPHQLVILDDDFTDPIKPHIQSKELDSFINELTEEWKEINKSDFYQLYYEKKLNKLEISTNEIRDSLEKQLSDLQKKEQVTTNKISEQQNRYKEISRQIDEIEKENIDLKNRNRQINAEIYNQKQKIDQLLEKRHSWWSFIKHAFDKRTMDSIIAQIEIHQNKMHELQEIFEKNQSRMTEIENHSIWLDRKRSQLKENLSYLHSQKQKLFDQKEQIINQYIAINQQIQSMKKLVHTERELKEQFQLEGNLFELPIHANRSILMDIVFKSQNLYLECTISLYCVEKNDRYFLPYEMHHPQHIESLSIKRMSKSSRYHTINQMTQNLLDRIRKDLVNLNRLL